METMGAPRGQSKKNIPPHCPNGIFKLLQIVSLSVKHVKVSLFSLHGRVGINGCSDDSNSGIIS